MPTIHLYSEIIDGDAARIVAMLAEDAGQVEVRINSPGGSVAEGLAIFNALKPRKPIVYIDGIAASIASLIAMSGNRIVMAQNALMMVHWPWVLTEGNASAMRKMADTLDKFGESMLGAYSRTGLDKKILSNLLDAETWLDTTEALRLGFADEAAIALPIAARFDLSKFRHPPKDYSMTHSSASSQAATATNNEPVGAAVAQAACAEGKSRASEVNAAVELNTLVAMALEMPSSNPDNVRRAAIEALRNPTPASAIPQFRAACLNGGERPSPLAGNYTPQVDGTRHDFQAAAGDALAMRAGAMIEKPHAGAMDLRGSSIADIARACLSRAGKSHGNLARHELIRAALSTSDFPGILSNTVGRMLRAGYENEPATHRVWVKMGNVPNFKSQNRVILGTGPSLEKVPEGGEFTSGDYDEDSSLPFKVDTYGRMITLSRQALINDDLGAFHTIVRNAGQAGARLESDLVYASLLDNAGAGQTMQDSNSLFHSAHGNLATAQSALDATALGIARTLLRRQTAVGGGVLNLQPKFLIVPPELEQVAEILLAASAQRITQGTDQTLAAPWLAGLTLAVEPRLPAGAFYLVASNTQIDTYELAMLEGRTGPEVDESDDFSTAGHSYRLMHDVGGRFLDWRGITKVPVS